MGTSGLVCGVPSGSRLAHQANVGILSDRDRPVIP